MKTTTKETKNIRDDSKRLTDAFWRGWLSIFDLSGQSFISMPDLENGMERDREAIASDWQKVGDDLRWAMNQVPGGR
jgi:hypothetical protein